MIKVIKLKKYSDDRGSLVENTLESIMKKSRHFFVSKSKAGVVRGNHYHNRKSEWFYLIQGKCKIVIENIISHKREEKIISEVDNIIVSVLPGHAHAIKNIGKKEMILLALINEVLDQKKPDTFFYKVL